MKSLKRSVRTASRLGVIATVVGIAFAGLAAAAPANAVADIVNLPTAPTHATVNCTPANTATVASTAAFSAAYTNSAISCINLAADIDFEGANTFTGVNTALNRSLSIDGQGHNLTFGIWAATGNRPFFLQNQSTYNTGLTFQLHNMNVTSGWDVYLVSGTDEKATGWDVVFDGVKLDGIPGYGEGSPSGRPVSGYLANVFLEGTGSAVNTFGRTFPRNVIVEPGAKWALAPAQAGKDEPQLDMSFGLGQGPAGSSGQVWVLGDLNVDGGAYSAIFGFGGLYVGSEGALTATTHTAGITFGALTTAAGGAGTGDVWVDNGGSLSVTNDKGMAIYAVLGAPLDMRADPGSSVVITGNSDPGWAPASHLAAITMATAGSSLQFNEPAILDIKNEGNQSSNNWAVAALSGLNSTFTYNLDIYDAQQISTWNHSTPIAANPDASHDDATLLTNADGAALSGSSPSDMVSSWNSDNYRRIFAASTPVNELPLINPLVALITTVGAVAVAGAVALPLLAKRRRASSTAKGL